MKYALQLLIAATIAGAVVYGITLSRLRQAERAGSGAPVSGDLGAAPSFTLEERSGRTFSSDELRGKVWIADFIFTRCAGPCPRMTSRLQKVLAELGDAADLRLVSFTMDPTYDTPEVLAKYADRHDAPKDRWIFLTADDTRTLEKLSAVGFRLAASAEPDAVIHSSRFILVDRRGRIRGYFEAEERDEKVVLRELVAEARKCLEESAAVDGAGAVPRTAHSPATDALGREPGATPGGAPGRGDPPGDVR